MQKIKTRRNTNRIPQHNYSIPGQYFVTICVENRQQLFGMIKNEKMILNDIGNMVNLWWQEMVKQYKNISIDEYIIMPNHIHGIINIVVGADLCVRPNQCIGPEQNNISNNIHKINHNGRTHRSAPTISDIIQWFKTMTTNKYIQNIKNNNWQPFNKRLWQRNFHDHIIRNDKSLNKIREYIINNPVTWQFDIENPDKIDNIKPGIINV